MLRLPSADAEQVWHCNPLAIVDDEGVIAFAGQVDVEFKPELRADRIGFAKMLGVTHDGWTGPGAQAYISGSPAEQSSDL